jgi:type I restriction enzyme M protein
MADRNQNSDQLARDLINDKLAELIARGKTSLEVFWLRDKSLIDLDNLADPDVLAEEIIENLQAGIDAFRQVLPSLQQAG